MYIIQIYIDKQTCLFWEFLRSQAASTCYLPYPKLRPAPKRVVALRNMALRIIQHGVAHAVRLFQSWDLQQELIL